MDKPIVARAIIARTFLFPIFTSNINYIPLSGTCKGFGQIKWGQTPCSAVFRALPARLAQPAAKLVVSMKYPRRGLLNPAPQRVRSA